MFKLKYHIDKIGVLGSIFSTLCCLGFPAIISLLTAIGAGFLINDAILVPFLIISLVIAIIGIFISWLRHKKTFPFILAIISSVVIFVFLFVVYAKVLIYAGLIGLVVSSIFSSLCIKKCEVK